MGFFVPGGKGGQMVAEIDAGTLRERLEAGERVQVVDIRQEAAYHEGHIPGAVNLPLERFARDVDAVDWGEEIVVACPIGESSKQAARLLAAYEGVAEGATVANLSGGYRAWDGELERE